MLRGDAILAELTLVLCSLAMSTEPQHVLYARSAPLATITLNRPDARNPGVIASFSRALTEALAAQQSDEEFDAVLDASIKSIYDASIT
jgi:hypothetical protein